MSRFDTDEIRERREHELRSEVNRLQAALQDLRSRAMQNTLVAREPFRHEAGHIEAVINAALDSDWAAWRRLTQKET